MTPFCVIDIETIPNTQSLPEGLRPTFDPDEVKTGNIKDEIKKQGKILLAKQEFDEALDKKMSLDPDLCKVVFFVGHDDIGQISYSQTTSFALIAGGWDFIKRNYLNHIPLVTFNGIGFDLPVLWHQAMILGIPVSAQMYSDLTKRYDNHYHYDLCDLLATWDYGKKKTKSLEFYLKLFGLGEKSGDGSEIYGWYKARQYDKIKEHCENDVRLTAKLFERLFNWIVKAIP